MILIRTYSDLIRRTTYLDRFDYLKLPGKIGVATFGFDRVFNQKFYRSTEWRQIRNIVIVRDDGFDMGDRDHPISGRVLIHHMNPLTINDIKLGSTTMLDPEYLICVSHKTHNAIHYGDPSQLIMLPKDRAPGDTKLW